MQIKLLTKSRLGVWSPHQSYLVYVIRDHVHNVFCFSHDCCLCDLIWIHASVPTTNSYCFHLCVRVNYTNLCSAWPAQRDELREIFNDISSSSEDEEDEGDRHEDEDLNIMDTEDDLVRQLQEKLNESDSAQHESDRNNQIGERISGFYTDLENYVRSDWNCEVQYSVEEYWWFYEKLTEVWKNVHNYGFYVPDI